MRALRISEWSKLYESLWRGPISHESKEYRQKLVRGCKGKAIYDSPAEAQAVADNLPERPGFAVNVYRCPLCSEWHIGNSRRR